MNRRDPPFSMMNRRSVDDIQASWSRMASDRRRKVVVKRYRHEGVFIAKHKKYGHALVTKNLVPGKAVYNDKIITVQNADDPKEEYRIWNPFHSNLAAAIIRGISNIWIKPGARVLYLGAACGSGTTVSHVSDIVGPAGVVYAVEFSHRRGRYLVNMAKKRTNIIPIIEDARHPDKYFMLVGMVDVILSDVSDQPDLAKILELNASYCLKAGGRFVTSIKANCIDSTFSRKVFFRELIKRRAYGFQHFVRVPLNSYQPGNTCVVGAYKMPKKEKED